MISVVIPTYAHRNYVCHSIRSVFDQTFTDHEIIVINDGSPDDTACVLKPLIDAGKIRYIEQPNAGQAAARNRGLREARGDFIAFLDDDDLWPPDKLAWQVDAMRSDPSLGAIAGIGRQVDEQMRPTITSPFFPEITFPLLFLGNPILSPGQTLVRTDLLRNLGGFNEAIWGADDWDLWFRIAQQSRMQMQNRVALTYRVHPGNASRDLKRMLANIQQVLETHLSELDPAIARPIRRLSQRYVYNYMGSAMARRFRGEIWNGQFRDALVSAAGMMGFVGQTFADPKLATYIVRDMLPSSLRGLLGDMRRRVLGNRFVSEQSPSTLHPPA